MTRRKSGCWVQGQRVASSSNVLSEVMAVVNDGVS